MSESVKPSQEVIKDNQKRYARSLYKRLDNGEINAYEFYESLKKLGLTEESIIELLEEFDQPTTKTVKKDSES